MTRGKTEAPRLSAQQTRTLKAQARFLANFAQTGNVLQAGKAAKVGRRTVYDWAKEDADFLKLFNEAKEDAIETLEEEARRRAVEGTLRPVYQGGEKVGSVREYSDTLLVLLLKGRRPEVYRERFEHTGKNGAPIKSETRVTFGGRYRPGQQAPDA